MTSYTKRPLTWLVLTTALLGLFVFVDGRPETNFASSAMTSDGTGSRSTQLVGRIPDSSYSPNYRMAGTNSGSSGVTIFSGSGGGTSSNGGLRSSGSTIVTGTSGSGYDGEAVGILTRSGPTGTSHTILGPTKIQQGSLAQPSIAGRYGSSGPPYTYPTGQGYYNDFSSYNYGMPSAVAVAGPGGAGSFASGGASSGAFAGSQSQYEPDYYG